MKKVFSNKLAIIIFVTPVLIIFTAFVFLSAARICVSSFYDWDGISTGKFVGVKMFTRLFENKVFYTSLFNGFISAGILLITQFVMGFSLAAVLSDNSIRFRKTFRTMLFLPVVLSITVGCLMGIFVLAGDNGLLNKIFSLLGITYRQNWLTNTKTSIIAVSAVNGWQYLGLYVCLFYSSIRSIPSQYFEAAIVDGANRLQKAWYITLPMCIESVKYCLLFALLGGLNQFAYNLIMTAGGPGESTYSLTLLMYQRAFGSNDYGYGSAVAVVIIIQSLLASVLVNKTLGKRNVVY